MLRKNVAIALIVIMVSSIFTVSAAALTDINNHWAGQYAVALNKLGIFNGDNYGNANLSDNITRAEFLALLVRAVYPNDLIPNGVKSFTDVAKGTWYYNIVSFAKQKGIILGDESGRLLPEENVKREEIVLMLVRALKLKSTSMNASFTDINKDYVYYDEICAAVESGIIKGYSDESFGPKNLATRGEAAAMIARMLGIKVDETTSINDGISGKINLSWQQLYVTGVYNTGEYMDGLNVISPTWFRIRSLTSEEQPASYEYKLDGDNSYYLQDLANVQYVSDAKAKGYKVWALFKSNDFSPNNNSEFLNDEISRKSAINLMRQMTKKYDLDGINMDFENMLASDKDAYTEFIKEMSEMAKAEGIVLSVDVSKYEPTSLTWSMCYDRKAIANYADYVILMAYDEYGVTSTAAGSVGDMPWVENAIKKTLEEVPSSKLILGVPFYARLWQSQDGKVIKTSAIGMDTAQSKIADAGAQIVYDQATGQNYATWEKDGIKYEIWLEDSTSMKNRISFVDKYNLVGLASWCMGFENDSIWKVIKENLDD